MTALPQPPNRWRRIQMLLLGAIIALAMALAAQPWPTSTRGQQPEEIAIDDLPEPAEPAVEPVDQPRPTFPGVASQPTHQVRSDARVPADWEPQRPVVSVERLSDGTVEIQFAGLSRGVTVR